MKTSEIVQLPLRDSDPKIGCGMHRWLLGILGPSIAVTVACHAPQPEAKPQPDYRPIATVKDIMASMVDGCSRAILPLRRKRVPFAISMPAAGRHDGEHVIVIAKRCTKGATT